MTAGRSSSHISTPPTPTTLLWRCETCSSRSPPTSTGSTRPSTTTRRPRRSSGNFGSDSRRSSAYKASLFFCAGGTSRSSRPAAVVTTAKTTTVTFITAFDTSPLVSQGSWRGFFLCFENSHDRAALTAASLPSRILRRAVDFSAPSGRVSSTVLASKANSLETSLRCSGRCS